jgi:hypothetical protein
LLILLPLGFAGAALVDFHAGNISMFEQLLIWLSFACLLRGRWRSFLALILVAGSFKILPLSFLLLLGLEQRSAALRRLGFAGLGLVLMVALQALLAFDLLGVYWSSVELNDERGSINPCSYAFWGSLLHFLEQQGLLKSTDWLRGTLYLGGVLLILSLGMRPFIRRMRRDRWSAILMATVVYALVMPRFKDYSYLLLIPAGAALALAQPGAWRALLLTLLLCLPTHELPWIPSEGLRGFLSYYPLYCAAGLWLGYCRMFQVSRDHADQNNRSPG